MKYFRIFLAGVCILLANSAQAFQECDNIARDSRFNERRLKTNLLNRIPVKYLLVGKHIKLEISNRKDFLFPHAYPGNLIVLPKDFLAMACRVVLTEYLYLKGIKLNVIKESAQEAAKCIERKNSQKKCLMDYANTQERVYTPYFEKLPGEEKRVALHIFYNAVYQILVHEYAHIFLDHFRRIKQGKLKRIDAEFESDFFAVMNGVQEAEPPSAMYYFFVSIADIQKFTHKLDSSLYESGYCRSQNVENITSVIGIEPMLIVDASAGGGYRLSRNSPKMMRQATNNRFKQPPKFTLTGNCGHLSAIVLRNAYKELKQLYDRVNVDLEYLFSKNQEKDISRAKKYLSDLSRMSFQFRYMNGVAAKSVASFLRGWEFRNKRLSNIINQVDAIVNIRDKDNNFLTGDFGRILLARGLAVLQEQSYLERNKRLAMAGNLLKSSVYYNPLLSEAWMNLAFISLERVNCRQASQYANRALATLSDNSMRVPTQQFAKSMQEHANDKIGCKSMADKFSAYPGL